MAMVKGSDSENSGVALQEASSQLHYHTLYAERIISYRRLFSSVLLTADLYVADIYLLALAILGSILLYPAGGLAYIDALFFASGSATQSGLNTSGFPVQSRILQEGMLTSIVVSTSTTSVLISRLVPFVARYSENKLSNLSADSLLIRLSFTSLLSSQTPSSSTPLLSSSDSIGSKSAFGISLKARRSGGVRGLVPGP